jgi:hypothetical protein
MAISMSSLDILVDAKIAVTVALDDEAVLDSHIRAGTILLRLSSLKPIKEH